MLKYLIITVLTLYSSLSAGYYGEIASLEYNTGISFYNSLVQVDANTYALAYRGNSADGFITTFTISADGSTITEVASLEHDTGVVQGVSLVQVDSDTYALAYQGADSDGSTITEVASLENI